MALTDNTPDHNDSADLHRMLRDAVAGFADKNTVTRSRNLRQTTPGFDRKMWKEFADNGWLGVLIPEKFGGQELGFAEARIVAEELAKVLAPEPFVASCVLSVCALATSGNDALKQRLLPKIASGETIIGVALYPQVGRIAVDQTPVTAKTDTQNAVLNGTLHHVFPALGADGLIVAAKDGGTFGLYYVATNTPGVSITEQFRADGTAVGIVTLKDVRIPSSEIIVKGDGARATLQYATDAATIIACAELQSIMAHALDTTLAYMRTRVQFGRPIGTFQALQHRAVDLYVQSELSRCAVSDAVALLDASGSGDELSMMASRAKSRCGDAGMLIGRESIKLHGAIGFTDEYDIGLYLRRTIVLTSWLGSPSEHRLRYGKLLKTSGLLEEKDESIEATGPFSPVFLSDKEEDVDWNAFSDREFRAGVRAYIEKTYPHELRNLPRRGKVSEMKECWLDKLVAKGWGAPAWPKQYGGWALSPSKQLIWIEERERVGVSTIPGQGLTMLGPILMKFGSEEQKRYYLPKIITNEHVWCQGYSEPNAGSDLASLQTEAKLEGDEWVINGSKIWTSSGDQASHIFVLARTSKEGRKQEGISFFIMDIKTPGITVRPIPNLSGHPEFCQEFFDNVRIPRENLIGEPNKGWSVAKSLLSFERLNSGNPRRASVPYNFTRYIANELKLWDDPDFYSRFVKGHLDLADHGAFYESFCGLVRMGAMPGPEISALKINAGEVAQRNAELAIDAAGASGVLNETQRYDGKDFNVLAPFYAMFGSLIASGSNDIQRNVLTQHVLNLPVK